MLGVGSRQRTLGQEALLVQDSDGVQEQQDCHEKSTEGRKRWPGVSLLHRLVLAGASAPRKEAEESHDRLCRSSDGVSTLRACDEPSEASRSVRAAEATFTRSREAVPLR